MAHRLLIIQPSHYRSKTDQTVVKTTRPSLVPLNLPYLAALTPADWKITLVDESLDDIPFEKPVDLVAITTHTITSLRAYDIAREFRKRRVPVILGGPHVFFYPEEAAGHCDAIGIGEGEMIWARMLADAAAGRLQPSYRAQSLSTLERLPFPRHDLLELRRYSHFKTFAVQSTRGCPYACDFCSERLYLGNGFRCRPVGDVIEEIKRTRSRSIFLAESNFGGKRDYALELMAALVPLKLRWSSLLSINYCADREFLDLAQRSGILHVNLGMESIDPGTIAAMRKRQNRVHQYAEILADLRRRGISYSLNFIFGWDTETSRVFGDTLAFLRQHKVPVAYFNLLTPEKGTPYYDRMLEQNRILNRDEIGRYARLTCYIKPAWCSPEELERRVHTLSREFYSLPSMVRRLGPPVTKANLASWVLNFSMRNVVRENNGRMEFDRW